MMRRFFPAWAAVDRQWVLRLYLGALAVLVIALAEPSPLSLGVGLGTCLLGLALRIWTRGFRAADRHFPDYGPYRFTRHPFYLGSFFAMMGLSLACRSPVALATAMLMTLVLFPLILQEEAERARQGDAFAFKEYQTQVPRFLPSLIPYGASRERRPSYSFTFALFAPETREVNALLLFAVAFAYLAFLWAYQGQLAPWRWAAATALGVFLMIRYGRAYRHFRQTTLSQG